MSERTLEYQPALDGVRALAVTLVVLFHLGLTWMPAGYLGVSVFFTLSGYLITSLLVVEGDRTGRISFSRFYARRARRLLPASLLCLVVLVVIRWSGGFALVPRFRAELVGAVAQVYNWVVLAGSSSYGSLFGRAPALTSPLEHYWSLAIEEQFYLLWPAVVFLLWRRTRRRGTPLLRPVLALTVLFGAVGPVVGLVWGADAAYWATPARLGELLVGASVAVWLHGRRVGDRLALLAPIGVAGVVACSLLFPSGSGPAFTGWLTPFALLTAALIVGLQVPGPVRTALSWRPVVWVGRVSYGLYLAHWPVFVLLRTRGWTLTTWHDALGAVGLTVAITAVSFRLWESPIRAARWSPGRTGATASVALASVLAATLVVPVGRGFLEADQQTLDQAAIDTGAPAETLARPSTTVAPSTTAEVVTTTTLGEALLTLPPTPNRPVRILVVGDSTAFYAGQGLAAWAVQHPADAQVDVLWCQGCGFLTDGTITSYDAGNAFVAASDELLHQKLPARIAQVHPDIVMLMVTVDDIADRQWDPTEGTLTPRDAPFRRRMVEQYRALTDALVAQGVPEVAWVVPPVPHSYFPTADLGEEDRYAIHHEVIREVVAAVNDPRVTVCDLDGWFVAAGLDRDTGWRPDGTHLTEESAARLAERWLGPWLVSTALGIPTP